MGRLSSEQRQRAVGMSNAGMNQTAIARHFNVNRSTISRLLERLRVTGSVADRPRSGQPRKTDARTDRWIVSKVLRNRKIQSPDIQRELSQRHIRVSSRLIRNRLKSAGLKSRRPYKGIVLGAVHRRNRLRWARREIRHGLGRWQSVLMSDESRFSMQGAD